MKRTRAGAAFKDEDWKYSSDWEKYIAANIITLSDEKLAVEFRGFGSSVPKRIKDDRTQKEMSVAPFDLLIKKRDVEIAEIEVAADRKYTWVTSHILPTRADKVTRAKNKKLPCFMVYVFTKEDPPLVVWLPFEKIGEYPSSSRFVEDEHGAIITLTDNFYVPKEVWNRGLQSLVEFLLQVS